VSTTATNSAPPALTHKHKKQTGSSAAIKASVAAAGANASQSGAAAAANKETPGSLYHLEGNNAGGQNMLSGDHTPGTTGTSGQ
jgi:hypothetical protein